ncbi:LysR family transcriptional regulator [uncultured Adlercreutzia sp.]|uniref:LysR family transcriptional regulator n=1 Tax=uncultured Adlercreutzia sp. TaxID=875803 RepID=UPI0025E1390A|nr:LysR family transcriptional regulator [uncultured Adlercreutzia sp.]
MYNHQLDTFLQVADKGSFSKAAVDLYISPTAVIKQMNLLEATLGVTLFNRTHRGLTLTAAGKSLYHDAKHIIQYCGEAADRARQAEAAGRHVVRVGSSPMTPSTFLTSLWPSVLKKCPGATIKLVTFENTPENARRILANLGEDIDIVAGAYDEAFLASRGCAAMELSREPLRIIMSASHPLAGCGALTLEDLEGQRLLVIQRGWNRETDRLVDDMRTSGRDIAIEEFPFINVDIFNRCEESGELLVGIDPWRDVHPLLVSKPVAWDYALPFGILHAPEPTPHVRQVLEVVAEVTARD